MSENQVRGHRFPHSINSAQGLKREALQLLAQGDYRAAESLFLDGMRLYQDDLDGFGHPTFRKELIRMWLNLKDWAKAEELADKAAKEGDYSYEVLFARAYASEGDFEGADRWWSRVSDREPGHPEARAWFENPRASVWPSQGVEFWGFLIGILCKTTPSAILELGSGRSTCFLADYAYRHSKICISCEDSEVWYQKVLRDLAFMDVRGKFVYLLRNETSDDKSWYNYESFKRVTSGFAFDMVFIDGPKGSSRADPRGQTLVYEVSRNAKTILVDDVDREHNMRFFNRLTRDFPTHSRYRFSYGTAHLAVGTRCFQKELCECFEFFGISYEVVE